MDLAVAISPTARQTHEVQFDPVSQVTRDGQQNPSPDCSALVEEAIKEDKKRNYGGALKLYRASIGILLEAMEKEKQKDKRKQLKPYVKELLRRAEEIQEYLSRTEKSNNRSRLVKETKKVGITHLIPNESTSEKGGAIKPTWSGDKNDAEEREKEWAFHLDFKFDMRSKIKTPGPSEDSGGSSGGMLSPVTNVLRLLGY